MSQIGWYHNGTDTTDSPEIIYWPHAGGEPYAFCSGPFLTFSIAKRNLLEHHRIMRDSHKDALVRARGLKEPK